MGPRRNPNNLFVRRSTRNQVKAPEPDLVQELEQYREYKKCEKLPKTAKPEKV